MKLTDNERSALAEFHNPEDTDWSKVHGRTLHALQRKGLVAPASPGWGLTPAGKDELAKVPPPKPAPLPRKGTAIGLAPVVYQGAALYLTMGGGEFTHDKIKGKFAANSAGDALVVYIEGDAYELDIRPVIDVAVQDHKRRLAAGKAGRR